MKVLHQFQENEESQRQIEVENEESVSVDDAYQDYSEFARHKFVEQVNQIDGSRVVLKDIERKIKLEHIE